MTSTVVSHLYIHHISELIRFPVSGEILNTSNSLLSVGANYNAHCILNMKTLSCDTVTYTILADR